MRDIILNKFERHQIIIFRLELRVTRYHVKKNVAVKSHLSH